MLLDDYKYLHQIPELSFLEFKTSAYIIKRLENTNAKIYHYKTAVLAFFDFQADKTIAFRAEEDALPLKEENTFDYIAKENMHACGHDGHMAILLALSEEITHFKTFKYNILLIFQPSEEVIGGSLFLIPYLKKYNIEALIGLHVFPKLKKGLIYTSLNAIFSSSMEIDIEVKGKASHVFTYQEKNDALKKAIKLMHELEIKAKENDLFFHVGYFKSGKQRNICPDNSLMQISLRGKDNEKSLNFKNYLKQIKNKDYIFKFSSLIPCVKNTYPLEEKLINNLHIKLLNDTLFLADDFAFYSKYFPTLFFLLGTESKYFLHDNKFYLEETDLKNGFNFLLELLTYFQFH